MRALALLLAFLAAPAFAQDERMQTLADIRQQLEVLKVELLNLQRELSTTGAPVTGAEGSTVLDRMASLEGQLQRLTAKTEELENRIDNVVRDGTNRIDDLTFQLTELAGGDLSALPPAAPLGGEAPQGGGTALPPPDQGAGGGAMAVGEQADFDRAKAAFDAGDFQGAAGLFQSFTQTYTAGPLNGEAHFWRGEALARTGQTSDAARAFLDSFSVAPQGAMAPQALFRLGQSLSELGQAQEACVTLAEVGFRYPGTQAAIEAEGARANLGCQ
jgi:tol-pal system protein YbgF